MKFKIFDFAQLTEDGHFGYFLRTLTMFTALYKGTKMMLNDVYTTPMPVST